MKQFKTILADPPWSTNQTGRFGASRHYDVMDLADICQLPVGDLAEPNAHLWLRFGLGSYLRNQTEHLLLGVRGRAPIKFKAQGSWMYAPLQDHSHKPEEQYAVIERCSDGPYLELFARRKWRTNWSYWGNEVDCDIRFNGLG